MKNTRTFIILSLLMFIFSSCATSVYITDQKSIQNQKEMRRNRTGRNFLEAGILFAAAVGEALTDVNVYPVPAPQSFRKLVLVNKSKDTLFVNMVTDHLWKDSTYCDIRDIVLPPLVSAKVVVPMDANYNVFFRNDFNAPDDEKVEINTANIGRVKLKPEKGKTAQITGN